MRSGFSRTYCTYIVVSESKISNMSQPKKRKHPHHTNIPKQASSKIYYRVIPVAIIIFILFGMGITFFAAGFNVKWLTAGAVIGSVCGFFFGYLIAKGLLKK